MRLFRSQPGQYIRLPSTGAPPRDYSLANLPDRRISGTPRSRGARRSYQHPDHAATSRSAISCGLRARLGPRSCREEHRGPDHRRCRWIGAGSHQVNRRDGADRQDPQRRSTSISVPVRRAMSISLITSAALWIFPIPPIMPCCRMLRCPAGARDTSPMRWPRTTPVLAGAKVYAAGPPPMMDAVQAAVQSLGVENETFTRTCSSRP